MLEKLHDAELRYVHIEKELENHSRQMPRLILLQCGRSTVRTEQWEG